MKQGTLFIVATPIGNLSDISFRAVEILKSVSVIAAEDTRHSHTLLAHYQINTPLISYHAFNEKNRLDMLIERLNQGENVALISDAGTPLINDPGFILVQKLKELNYRVVPVPGACALIAALCASGFPTEQFIFEGFFPSKSSAARKRIEKIKSEMRTIIFYETPHRILKSLELLIEVLGPMRKVCIARELTKNFETILTDTLENLRNKLISDSNQQKGEFVLIVEGAEEEKKTSSEIQEEALLKALMTELSLKQAVRLAVKITGSSRKTLYDAALKISKSNSY